MPEENEVSTTQPRRRNERTEAKFFEHAELLIAEAEALGADYDPPNEIAEIVNLNAKRTATGNQRTVHKANAAAEENVRNTRENLFKSVSSDITRLTTYAESAGKPDNEIEALRAISRDIKGQRAKAVNPDDGKNHISVSNRSYVSITDNYERYVEQYDTLNIETDEDFYKADTHRAKIAALRQSTADVIAAETAANKSGEQLDKLAYTDADSLMNGCISGKKYIKSKYKTTGEPYKNIAKTRFELPSRLRKK